MKRTYYAKSKVKNDPEIICTFDTETQGLGGDVLCLSYSLPSKTDIFIGADCVNQWLESVFFQYPSPAIHYAHFAQYDLRYILPTLIRMQESGEIELQFRLRTETDIFRIEVKRNKKKFIIHDSYALYPDTLKNFSAKFSPEKQKNDLDFSKVQFDVNNPNHIEYAKRDAETLRLSMLEYSKQIRHTFGVQYGQTAAGTAVKAWQSTLPDDEIIDYSIDGELEQFIRSAYYGGVVFLTDTAPHKNCKTFDINSSYPASMLRYPVPIGKPRIVYDLQFDYPAIYYCRVKAPDQLQIPIIPTRDQRGYLRWYSGEFETHCTNIELQFAMMHGYELLEIYSGYQWQETIKPFEAFISKCRQIRQEHKGTTYETIAKLMQNSLYGKFGAKRERSCLIFGQENIDPAKHQEVTKLQDFAEDVYSAIEYSEDMPCKPEFAVFITAYSRINLLSTAYALGVDNVLYGDTDSLTVKETANISLINVGLDYGQFKLEKTWSVFRAIAPKTYTGVIEGEYKGKAKGAPSKQMTQEKFAQLFGEGVADVEYDTLPSLIVALKKGIEPAKPAHRRTSDLKNSQHFACIGTRCYLKSAHDENHQPERMETAQG